MARYPSAIWTPLPGIGGYSDGAYKIIHHTTEGSTAAGAIATYKKTRWYPHFTVEGDAVYQHVDTESAVTALEHNHGTPETNRSRAIQIEVVGYAGRPKSPATLRTVAKLCRWLEELHDIPAVWPNGFPYPPVNGKAPNVPFNRDEANWRREGGHYGHCHVPHNIHWDPGYTAEEVAIVMEGASPAASALDVEATAIPEEVSPAAEGVEPEPLSRYVLDLVGIAEGEYSAFHGITEGDEPLRSRIDEYCRAVGVPPPVDIAAFPWSAVFVSWCVKQAGATASEFAFSAEHAVFVKAAIANADAERGVFRARPIEAYPPRVGDLIHRNRSGGTITYAQARHVANYPSHSAIVVEVGEDRRGRYAITIGGNEQDSVRKTRVGLNADGTVFQSRPNLFICVVQDLKIDGAPRAIAFAADAGVPAASSRRIQMAEIIVGFEARRDSKGRLEVYRLPPGDGGGRYEVAGINERYDKVLCDQLVDLIKSGQQAEAERRAVAFIADQTDVAQKWTENPGVEFYLRDCVFNRGARGAAWILQRAVGVATDGAVGPITLAAVARRETDPLELLRSLRQAREAYERPRRDESSIFWKGLVNRWNNALNAARTFLPGGVEGEIARSMPAADHNPGFAAPPSGGRGSTEEPAETSPTFASPDHVAPGDLPGALKPERMAVASAAIARGGPFGSELFALHGELEGHIFRRPVVAAFAAGPTPPGPETMIVGVGIGAAQRDFESVGPGGPGAPVLNVYVAESLGMDAVKRVLVDVYGMSGLKSDTRPVNVFHCGPIRARSHTHFERPSPCGISVGHFKITAGTQGALARGSTPDRQGRLLLLSNNHVLANCGDCEAGDAIRQPGPLDTPRGYPADQLQIGVLEQWVPIDFTSAGVNYVDCATAWCWPERVRKEFIRPAGGGAWDYFSVASTPVEAAPQAHVGKSGRTTQLTSGQILDVNASISVNYGGRIGNFREQITIKGPDGRPFSDSGDSGSLIWTWDEKRSPVGLLFAGGRDLTFANKIQNVLEALQIALYV